MKPLLPWKAWSVSHPGYSSDSSGSIYTYRVRYGGLTYSLEYAVPSGKKSLSSAHLTSSVDAFYAEIESRYGIAPGTSIKEVLIMFEPFIIPPIEYMARRLAEE